MVRQIEMKEIPFLLAGPCPSGLVTSPGLYIFLMLTISSL